MFQTFIFHQAAWWMVIAIICMTIGSCNASKPTPPPPTSIDDMHPDPLHTLPDSADATSDSSSGYASDSADSASSSFSGYTSSSAPSASSSSSGYASASSAALGSTSSLTDFAGLPNMGNTCYMNAVLQIIAALYTDAAHSHLKEIVDKINTGAQPLDRSYMQQFIAKLPKNTEQTETAGKQRDPGEFIEEMNKNGYFKPQLIHVSYIDLSDKKLVSKYLYKLLIPSTWLTQALDLSQVIQSYQAKKLKEDLDFYIETTQDERISVDDNCVNDYNGQTRLNLPDKCCIELVRNADSTKTIINITGIFGITIKPNPNLDDTIGFDLHGCIVHSGDSVSSGHYVAYVKRNGKWYKADDTVIEAVDQSKVIDESGKAYLLFYTKK